VALARFASSVRQLDFGEAVVAGALDTDAVGEGLAPGVPVLLAVAVAAGARDAAFAAAGELAADGCGNA
jgi:hypothetical protein